MATVSAPPLWVQGDLFGAGAPAPGPLVELGHVALSHGAWIEHAPGWLRGRDQLFDQLTRDVAWQVTRRQMYDHLVEVPRLSAWCDLHEAVVPPELRQAAELLGAHYGEVFTTAGLNLYRDGSDSVAWHGDRVGRTRPQTVIPLISLGERRPFLLKAATGGPSLRFELGRGDLLVMGGTCQLTWRHCVPKVTRAAPRLSVAFRSTEATGALSRPPSALPSTTNHHRPPRAAHR